MQSAMRGKKVPKGSHMMPDGSIMKDSDHKGMKKMPMKKMPMETKAMPMMKAMDCDERMTIPKTMTHPHGMMFHHIVNPGKATPGAGGGSPY